MVHRHLIFPCVIGNDMVTETLKVQGQLSVEEVYRDTLHMKYKIKVKIYSVHFTGHFLGRNS